MPGMDGFEFVRRLREIVRQKDVPVIALTGFGRAEDVGAPRPKDSSHTSQNQST